MGRIYGYCRISTRKQHIERQVDNILKRYPDATIIQEAYTGTKIDRPAWNRLYKDVVRRAKEGEDITIVFDEVSRMSRNADDGFQLYKELYGLGIHLVFLKEPHINTDVYRETLAQHVSMTGTEVDVILKGVNEYLMILAEKQIRLAFQTAQSEVDYLHQRTSEGVRKAQLAGRRVGTVKGDKLKIRKRKPIEDMIRKYSRDFDGTLTDAEVMSILKGRTVTVKGFHGQTVEVPAGVARNTYYKYKRDLR